MKRALANFFAALATRWGAELASGALQPLVKSEWTPAQALVLDAYLRSPPGQAFFNRLQSVATAVAVNGCRNQVNTIHAAGISAGWDEAVRYINSLSRVSRVPDTTTDETPRGETELLEQLSP